MRLSVIGCGYLGAVHAASMAQLGHDVIGIDVDAKKIDALREGRAPFYEPGLPELLTEAGATGRLSFSTDMADAAGADVHFICVGTPQVHGEFRADLTYVNAATAELQPHLRAGRRGRRQVDRPGRHGGGDRGSRSRGPGAILVWNPEFLREGFAVKDTLHPDRLVYGVPTDDDGRADGGGRAGQGRCWTRSTRRRCRSDTPLVVTDYATAQLVKVAANSFLATKISFINAMAELCEATGADVTRLADAIGYDARIGRRFLNAGLGFGGGCLPKDIRAFMARAGELGVSDALSFLREVDSINMRRRVRMVDLAREVCDGLDRRQAGRGARVRRSSRTPTTCATRRRCRWRRRCSCRVPTSRSRTRRRWRTRAAKWPDLHFAATALEAAKDADVVLLATEWAEYREIDPDALAEVVAHKRILDGRNVLEPAVWRAAGWTYRALGRP